MLSPRWRKMLRDASLHRARTVLVIAAMAVGLSGAGALLGAWALVKQVTAQTFLASRPVSATLRLDAAVDDKLLAVVREIPAVAAVRARRVTWASADAGGRRTRAQLFTLSAWQSQDIGQLRPEHGTWPPRDGEIVVEPSSLEFAGTALGQNLRIKVGEHAAQALPVSGITRDVSLPPGWMDHVVYAFVTPATLQQLGASSDLNEIQFVVRDTTLDRDAVRRIAAQARTRIEQAGVQVSHIAVPVPGEHEHAAQMDSLSLTQGAFGLMTLLVCALLVVNLIAAMLAAQTREIGVMKVLGGSPRQIGVLYLGYALAIGAVATVISLPVSLLIARPYAAMKLDMLNFPIGDAAVSGWALVLQLAVGCLLPVAAAALPVLRACRLPAAEALRDSGIATPAHAVSRRIILPGFSRPLLLSLSNALRKRERLLLTVLALAAGGAVFIGADNLRSGVRGSVAQLFAGNRYEATLRLTEGADAEQAQSIAAGVPGVSAAQALSRATTALRRADGLDGDAFTLAGLPPSSPLLVPQIQQGRAIAPGDGNVLVVNRSLLRDEPTLQLDAEVELRLDGAPSRWRVIGIVDVGPQPLAYAPLSALNAARGDERAGAVLLAMDGVEAAAQLDVILRVRAAFESAGIAVGGSELMVQTRRAFEDHLLMVVQFLGVMGWAMIAIGGLGLASTMSLGVLERTREIGVMRAIGASDRHIVSLVQVEGLFVAALAWCVSLLLAVPIGHLLAEAFGRVMFAVPMQLLPRAGGVLTWAGLLAVVSLLACTWPARRAVRLPTARVLAHSP